MGTEDQVTELTQGNRKVILAPLADGKWSVWVGYQGSNGQEQPALYFKGFTTCGAEYANRKNAEKAARKFLLNK
jgi:hypothetical protein